MPYLPESDPMNYLNEGKIIIRFIAENEEIFIRLHVLIDEQCLISSRHGIFF